MVVRFGGLFSQTFAWHRTCNGSTWRQCNLIQKRHISSISTVYWEGGYHVFLFQEIQASHAHYTTWQACLLLNHAAPHGGGGCRRASKLSKWANPRTSVRLTVMMEAVGRFSRAHQASRWQNSQQGQMAPREGAFQSLTPLCNKISATTTRVPWLNPGHCV